MATSVTSQPIDTTTLERAFTRADIEFEGLDHSSASYEGRVFINKPDADAGTPLNDPAYAGSYFIFGHGGCLGDVGSYVKRGARRHPSSLCSGAGRARRRPEAPAAPLPRDETSPPDRGKKRDRPGALLRRNHPAGTGGGQPACERSCDRGPGRHSSKVVRPQGSIVVTRPAARPAQWITGRHRSSRVVSSPVHSGRNLTAIPRLRSGVAA